MVKVKTTTVTFKLLNSFIPVAQDTPLATLFPDKISNLQSKLCVFQSEVMAMKSFILEQFLLTKEQQMNFQLPVKLMVNL